MTKLNNGLSKRAPSTFTVNHIPTIAISDQSTKGVAW